MPIEKLRLSLLTIISGSIFCVLAKTILAPATPNNTVSLFAPFVFPTVVSLPEWQLLNSHLLAAPIPKNLEYAAGRHYQYIQKNQTLDIEMRYMINTSGSVRFFISSILQLPSQLKLAPRQREGVGFYYLFAHEQRAYLSTCINSRGSSTVTELQFQQNRYLYDMHLSRLLAWLLGKGTFKDRRCLWMHLSTPVKNSTFEDKYKTLEQTWFDLYKWWQPRFPQS